MPVPIGPYVRHAIGDDVQAYLRRGGNWFSAGIHHSIAWPLQDVLVEYTGNEYVLRGLQPDNTQPRRQACVTTRCERGSEQTATEMYRFASILGWFLDGYVDVVGYASGSAPLHYTHTRAPYGSLGVDAQDFSCNFMPVIGDREVHIALAFWREGLRLEQVHHAYAFLSFYKVIESQFTGGVQRGAWIDGALTTLAGGAAARVAALAGQGLDVGDYIYGSGRCAVAHASAGRQIVDPDEPTDRARIASDLVVIKALAEKYIRDVHGVPDEARVSKMRDRLVSIYPLLGEHTTAILKSGGDVPRRQLGLNDVRMSVNKWLSATPNSFKQLRATVRSATTGKVQLQLSNDTGTLRLFFSFDLTTGRAHAIADEFFYQPPRQGGNIDDAITVVELRKSVLMNRVIEVELPDGAKVDCDVVIPENIDGGATLARLDEEINRIRHGEI